MGQIIPPADAARLIASNPRQARSEISLACERVIAGEPWLLAGRYSVEEVVGRYLDEVFGLGPLEEMLGDDSITEVMVNGRSRCITRETVDFINHAIAMRTMRRFLI